MKKVFKIGCGGIIALFVLLIVIGAIFGDETTETEGADKKVPEATITEKEKEEKEEKQKEAEPVVEETKKTMGEELTVGKVTFKANSIEEASEISTANGYMKYTPDAEGAVFLIVNATVKNIGTEAINTDSSFFKLITPEGAEYSPSSIIVTDDKYFMFESINPGLSLTGNVLFEVPASLTGLDLQVQTGFWGTETGLINLN